MESHGPFSSSECCPFPVCAMCCREAESLVSFARLGSEIRHGSKAKQWQQQAAAHIEEGTEHLNGLIEVHRSN
eukprot:4857616-Amphidinium_carterae.1